MVKDKYGRVLSGACAVCGNPCRKERPTCSIACGTKHRSGENHYLYNSGAHGPGKSVNDNGYVTSLVKGRRVRVHRCIAEAALGKELPKGAVVHHVDGNRLNNAHDNLVICEDTKYHHLLHIRARVLAHGGNPNTELLCDTCNMTLPFTAFYVSNAAASTGRTSTCKKCRHKYKQSVAKNKQ